MNRPLADWQVKRAAEYIEQIERLEMKVWSAFSPTSERDAARIYLNKARFQLMDLLREDKNNDN